MYSKLNIYFQLIPSFVSIFTFRIYLVVFRYTNKLSIVLQTHFVLKTFGFTFTNFINLLYKCSASRLDNIFCRNIMLTHYTCHREPVS